MENISLTHPYPNKTVYIMVNSIRKVYALSLSSSGTRIADPGAFSLVIQ